MTSRSRTLSGVALMLLIIPIFAGLLACMPVPIGDPERSRIDPDLSGIWAVLGHADADEGGVFYFFEPYDKRTWLVSGAGLEAGEESDLSAYDLSSYDGYVKLVANEPVDEEHISVAGLVIYKAWLKKLGGETFMTWEFKVWVENGVTSEPKDWQVFRVINRGPDAFQLQMVKYDSDLFDDVDKTRRAYERVISRNVNNPELYYPEDDGTGRATMVRAKEAEAKFFEKLLDSAGLWN